MADRNWCTNTPAHSILERDINLNDNREKGSKRKEFIWE
jgi:hypothetical protein